MSYQDYLPHTPYDELPAAIRAEIDRASYAQLREATGALANPPTLPPALTAAYRARVDNSLVGPTKTGVSRVWRMVALVGWGLLAIGLFGWLRQTPERVVVYRDAVPPPAEVVIRYDTVTTVRTELRERLRTVRDTVYVPVSLPVVRVDTLYAQPLVVPTGPASRSVADGPDWHQLTVRGGLPTTSK